MIDEYELCQSKRCIICTGGNLPLLMLAPEFKPVPHPSVNPYPTRTLSKIAKPKGDATYLVVNPSKA
jgi:hypothetical protein